MFAFVVLRGARPKGDASALVKELRNWVGEQLGAIAKPDNIRFADNLPKTRSGKIMRRLLRAIANNQPIKQDISTLENPAIVDQLRGLDTPSAQAKAPRRAARKAAPKRAKQALAKKKPNKKSSAKRARPPKRKQPGARSKSRTRRSSRRS